MKKVFEEPMMEQINLSANIMTLGGGESSGGNADMGTTSNPFPDIV